MDATETKPWYLSKGILGPIVTVIALAASLLGYQIDAATQAVVVDQVVLAITTGTAVVGAIVGAWGRVVATKKIG